MGLLAHISFRGQKCCETLSSCRYFKETVISLLIFSSFVLLVVTSAVRRHDSEDGGCSGDGAGGTNTSNNYDSGASVGNIGGRGKDHRTTPKGGGDLWSPPFMQTPPKRDTGKDNLSFSNVRRHDTQFRSNGTMIITDSCSPPRVPSSNVSEYNLDTLHDFDSDDLMDMNITIEQRNWMPPMTIVVENWVPSKEPGGEVTFGVKCETCDNPPIVWRIKKSFLEFKHLSMILEAESKGMAAVFPHVEDPSYQIRRMTPENIDKIRKRLSAFMEALCANSLIIRRAQPFHGILMEFVNSDENVPYY